MKDNSIWGRMPKPVRVLFVIGVIIYFGGGLIAPLFWRF